MMDLPPSLKLIRLELAREAGHPSGERGIGYYFIAPLDEEARIDADLWRVHRAVCTVMRFRPGEALEAGHLVRRGGGWAFHYEGESDEEDEAGFRFADHVFAPGEYVSIREDSGMHTYRVASVAPARAD